MLITKSATGSKYFDINDNMTIIIISSTLIEGEKDQSQSPESLFRKLRLERGLLLRTARLAQSIAFGWWL